MKDVFNHLDKAWENETEAHGCELTPYGNVFENSTEEFEFCVHMDSVDKTRKTFFSLMDSVDKNFRQSNSQSRNGEIRRFFKTENAETVTQVENILKGNKDFMFSIIKK